MPLATVQRVAVTRTASPLGERVIAKLRDRGADVDVVDISQADELKRTLQDVDAVVHLAPARELADVLAGAAGAGVGQIVFASTAAVYGAWADNAVPLTEDVPLRPNPGFGFARDAAEGERLLADWRDEHPDTRGVALRLVPILVPGGETWLSETLARPSLLRAADALPPAQVLHVEDAASAIVHAVEHRLDGTYNVAPDGYVAGETARALSAAGVPVALPDRLASLMERAAHALRIGGVDRSAAPYRLHPWVVANDRLRATGWSPAYTAEEAFVACRKGSWWRELSPNRRQQVALGVAGGALAAIASAAGALVVRASRRAGPS